MSPPRPLATHLPWVAQPLITSAPMRLISTAPLTCAVTRARGLGFLGAGTDLSTLPSMLAESQALLSSNPTPDLPGDYAYLPIGVGVITHKASLPHLIAAITPSNSNGLTKPPCAIWLFAPEHPADLKPWADALRNVTPTPQIWVQCGTVSEALDSVKVTDADVIICQGVDAGGHGLQHGSSIVPLVPETIESLKSAYRTGETTLLPDIIAAGGVMEGKGVAAALALGAYGVTLGTRLLATTEANIASGYKNEVVRAGDGGATTIRSRVYDQLRGTDHWPTRFGGRGVLNVSYEDWMRTGPSGMNANKQRYKEAEKVGDAGWGPNGRMTTYAGTGVGLVKAIKSAEHIVKEVREEAKAMLHTINAKL